jgi:DNA repair exonuclease SbcCD ATPase subunit
MNEELSPKKIVVKADVKYDVVYHIADTHIRLYARHEEYRQVFRRTFRYIQTDIDSGVRGLAVICGDLLHSKSDLSPNCIQLVNEFLQGFPVDVVLIMGNHDVNMGNKSHLDALTPIVKNMPGVYYLRDSGYYKMGNIWFGVSSIYDGGLVPASGLVDEKGPKVALYHGPVNGCISDVGTRLAAERTADDFAGWDIGMFGDIHRFQTPGNNCWWPGSLIAQRYTEAGAHGFIRWDMRTLRGRRVIVPNDWGYHTLDIKGGALLKHEPLSLHPRIKLRITASTSEEIQAVERQLRSTYDVQELIPIRMSSGGSNDAEIINDITTHKFLPAKLLKKYLARKKIEDEQIARIIGLHEKWREEVMEGGLESSCGGRWRPVKMVFSNLFSYRGTWQVSFPEGIRGVFGPNGSGKSSLVDILLFCLHDKTVRGDKKQDLVNKGSRSFQALLEFEAGGRSYWVYREGKLTNRGLNIITRFWTTAKAKKMVKKGGKEQEGEEEHENDQIEDLSGKDRNDTNSHIERIVGSLEETLAVGVLLQGSGTLFVDETAGKRKERINRILNLDRFDALAALISERKREMNAKLKILGASSRDEEYKLEDTYDKLKARIEEIGEKVAKLSKKRDRLRGAADGDMDDTIANLDGMTPEERVEDLRLTIDKLGNLLDELPGGDPDTDTIERLRVELVESRRVEAVMDWRNGDQQDDTLLIDRFTDIARRMAPYAGQQGLRSASERWKSCTVELEKIQEELTRAEDAARELQKHKYDPNCKWCCDNPFVKRAEALGETVPDLKTRVRQLEKLEKSLVSDHEKWIDYQPLEAEWTALLSEMDQMSQVASPMEPLQRWFSRGLAKTVSSLEAEIETRMSLVTGQLKRAKVEDQIAGMQRAIEAFEKLKGLDIGQYQKVLDEIAALERERLESTGTLAVTTERLERLGQKRKEIEVVTLQLDDLSVYGQAVGRDGLPKELTAKLVPQLEQSINDTIAQLADFSVTIEADTANIRAIRDGTSIDAAMCSGSEKLIIELGLRAVLATMCGGLAPSILVIDEGLNALDHERRNSLQPLLQMLCQHFRAIILISHSDAVKAEVDGTIVPKKGGDWKALLADMPTAR